MILAHMMNLDKNALLCDLAETYHIYDYRSLPLHMVGIFACGLREDSRIMMKISGIKIDTTQALLASIADNTRMLAWLQSNDGVKGTNRPNSLLRILSGAEQHNESNIETFESGNDFDEEWDRLTRGGR